MSEQRRYRFEEIIPTREPKPKLRSIGMSTCRQVGSKVFVVGDLRRGGRTVATFDFQENSWSVVDDQGEGGPPLCCHSSFICEDRLYLHGGRSKRFEAGVDLFFLDLVTLEWRKCITSVERPKARFWHIGEHLERLRKFIIFGGYAAGFSFGDLWALNVASHQWNVIKAKGERPTNRNGHSSCSVGETIYIYGGRGRSDRYTDDLHVLDCRRSRFAWSTAFVGLGICRCFSSLTSWNGELVLFGGFDQMVADTADLFVLQPPSYDPVKARRVEGATNISYKGYGHTVIATSTDLFVFDRIGRSSNALKLIML